MVHQRTDTVVVGGGILGVGVAYALAKQGGTVSLFEARTLASGASGTSFSWLNATAKDDDPRYHRLNRTGMSLYQALASEIGEYALGLNGVGMLKWSRHDGAGHLAHQVQRLGELGYPVECVGRNTLEGLEPYMAFNPDAVGLFAPADRWLDGPKAVRTIAEHARGLGAQIHEHCPVVALRFDESGRTIGVETAAGFVPAAKVVLASGTTIPGLLPHRPGASPFPVKNIPGLLVETPPDPSKRWIQHVIYSEAHGELHLRPSANGGLLLGAEDVDHLVAGEVHGQVLEEQRRSGAEILLERARRYLPQWGIYNPSECQLEVGHRPVPSDDRPIVGPLPGHPGTFLAVTHSGYTLGLAVGEGIAEMLEGDPAQADHTAQERFPQEWLPYACERFQL